MKMKALLVSLILWSVSARADSVGSAAAFVTGTAAAATTLNYRAYRGLLPQELEDWQDPASMSTSRLSDQCGLYTEVRLYRQNRQNLLFIGTKNAGEQTRVVDLNNVRAEFSNGRERRLETDPGNAYIVVRPNWFSWGFVPFHKKSDFKDQTSVTVKLPTLSENGQNPCEIAIEIAKMSEQQDERSYIEATSFDITIEMGAPILRSGLAKDYADDGLSFSMLMQGFGGLHHGAYLSINGLSYNDPNITVSGVSDPSLSQFSLGFGYMYRNQFNEKHHVYAGLGGEIGGISVNETGERGSYLNNTFYALQTVMSYDYLFARSYHPFWQGDYAVGLSLIGNFIPKDSGDIPIGGSNLSLLLRFRIGI